MTYILNSTEVIVHIPKKGITKKDLIQEMVKLRNLSKREAEKSIERALFKKTIIEKNDKIYVSSKVCFLR